MSSKLHLNSLLLIFCSFLALINASPIVKETNFSESLPNTGIIGGQDAEPGMFPFVVSLQSKLNNDFHFCGGSLISDTFVLTAAHCIKEPGEFTVRVGAHDLREQPLAGQRIEVAKTFVHPQYVQTRERIVNDIALIKLKNPVNMIINERGYGSTAKIKLANKEIPIGAKVQGAGWGRTSMNPTKRSPILKYGNYKLLKAIKCREAYLEDFGTDALCVETGNSTNSPCFGDSGGPLIVLGDKENLIGVASYLSDARNILDDEMTWKNIVYTKVSKYLDWIESVTGPL